MNTNKTKFNSSPKPTIGVELELFTVNNDNYALINGAPKILKHFNDNFFFKEELLQCIVEITTDVCDNVKDVYKDLRPKLDMAIEYSNNNSTWTTVSTFDLDPAGSTITWPSVGSKTYWRIIK